MAYDVGDTVPLAVDLRDASNNLVNAASVALTVTGDFDGTPASQTVTNPPAVQGQYRHTVTPANPGRYDVDWNFTNPTASYQDVFVVRAGAAIQLVSLADMKRQLNIATTDTTFDEELRDYIEAASGLAELISGVTMRATITETHHGGKQGIVLRKYPVLSIASVTENGTTVAASGYTLSDAGVLYRRAGGFQASRWAPGVNNVVVQLVAGRAIAPSAATLAVRIIAQHLWDTRRGASQITGLGGEDGVAVEMETTRMYGFAVPNRARELLVTLPKAPGFA